MQGCNPSADSAARIAGSAKRSRAVLLQAWQHAINPRGSGTESPINGDIFPEQLLGHYR
jgi:hypothetical protein